MYLIFNIQQVDETSNYNAFDTLKGTLKEHWVLNGTKAEIQTGH